MKVSGAWLCNQATQAVCAMLTNAGHQALFVGGCVRNALLNAPVGDIDIATDATPDRVVSLANGAGLKSVPTGLDHGTVTVVADGLPHEITTFRKDVETHGRHATVAFSTDITEDARRRDFTMNALYARPDGSVIDPLGGLSDLQARRVRFIDDARQRITEDYLRSLRFFRFHAWYGDPDAGLDADGLAAVAETLDGLDGLSRERIGAEILKLLSAPDPAPSVAAMRSSGVLARILTGANDHALGPLLHFEEQFDLVPDPIRRLACVVDHAAAETLRLSKAQLRHIALLRTEMADIKCAEVLGYLFGITTGMDILVLRAAVLESPPDPDALAELERGAAAQFPITAADLMPALQGPLLGERLALLEERWIASGFSLTKDDLLST